MYVVTRPPPLIDLKVVDGSVVGTIEGNLTRIGATDPLVRFFNVTSYANQSGYPSSTLGMHMQATTYYHGPAPGYAWIGISIAVVGRFAANVGPTGLALAANQTGTSMDLLQFQPAEQTGANVAFDPKQTFGILGNGSWAAEASCVNQTRAGTFYDFSYTAGFVSLVYLGSDYARSAHFVGFRATVNGSFTPSIATTILVEIIST